MQIKFLDLKAQYNSIKPEIDEALFNVIDSSNFILGPAVAKFEEDFARYCDRKYAIGVNSGTSALFLILKALGIGQGHQVITAANTFIATVAAIIQTGAEPVLVDIDAVTKNIDLKQIGKVITSRTKILMPVHLYGNMVDMDVIMSVADEYKLPVIEDAAQAHGAGFKGKRAGSFGLAAGFSFYPGKNLGAYGEGGAVVTSDDSLAAEIKKLRDHGFAEKYYSDLIGYNARMDGLQGAVLAVKLKHLDRWNQMRNRVADIYRQRLKDLPIGLPAGIDGHFQVYHQFVIEVDFRDEMQKYLRDNGVPTLIHYPIPVHKQKAFIDAGYKGRSFPVTERLADRILSLPVYPELKEEEIDYICSRIREFIERRAKN